MRVLAFAGGLIAAWLPAVLACGHDSDSCYGPSHAAQHVRHVKRIQPGAKDPTYGPNRALEWGQLNVIHTTDTHGWLEGHINEPTYSADWGDFASFVQSMKQTARELGVDLLLIDSGDLHDGTGLSDATDPDGEKSMHIFNAIPYDLLTVGNHELYVAGVSDQMFTEYATTWGDRYVTSNVKAFNKTSNQYETLGVTNRYFTTEMGLRVLALGVLFDFDGNSNASQVQPAKDMIKEPWFIAALQTDEPIDIIILTGHNPVRRTDTSSTLGVVFDAIRQVLADKPILIFGGHTHVRDFAVYDNASVALESGRYCETWGWLSMSGFNFWNSGFRGDSNPKGVDNPSRPATPFTNAPWRFSRRYGDWNRNTFMFHVNQTGSAFDTQQDLNVTKNITQIRTELNLGEVIGCVNQTFCVSCKPFEDSGNIFSGVLVPALNAIVVNETRADKSRITILNTGAVRFDLSQGPFTRDDVFIVVPFSDVFLSIQDVPYAKAKNITDALNKSNLPSKRDFAAMPLARDTCTNPDASQLDLSSVHSSVINVRSQITLTEGYVTTDDWGTDGDDTEHSPIPSFKIPAFFDAQANFPECQDPDFVDLIFLDFIEADILTILGDGFTKDMVNCYINCTFTVQDFLEPYARLAFQANKDDCPTA